MDNLQINAVIDNSDLWIFGIRVLHADETPRIGQEMAESYVWDDGDRSEEAIGGTCAFVVTETSGLWDANLALRLASEYDLGVPEKRYALLGGKYAGNNDLIAEPHTVAIRDAVVLATW